MNLAQLLSEFPPCLCRLLARIDGESMTANEIARVSGLDRFRVNRISQLTSWNNVPVGQALVFMRGCGVELLQAKRHREFIRRANWSHIVGSPYHLKLLTRLYNARNPASLSTST